MKSLVAVAAAVLLTLAAAATGLAQEGDGPHLVDRNLTVTETIGDLVTPIGIAFLGPDDMLVIEKNTGKVVRVTDGAVAGTVLDLSVNAASERGLLGITLHPDFPADPGVYLYWSCRSVAPLDADPFTPEEQRCSDDHMTDLADSDELLQVPLLGNRVDRFTWDGSALHYGHNLEAAVLPERRRADARRPGRFRGRSAWPAARARQP
jgi:hypothetical protein